MASILQAEQKAIYELNDKGKRPLTWAQTRNMPLTYKVCFLALWYVWSEAYSWKPPFLKYMNLKFQVILESMRTASIISFTFREAVVDVEYKGN